MGCTAIGIRKSDFVAKTQFLYKKISCRPVLKQKIFEMSND